MSFDYEPEMASNAWPDGSYETVITKVEERISKQHSDPMLVVSYKIYGAPAGPTKGQSRDDLKDYITAPPAGSGRKGSLFKLLGITEALGLAEKFKAKTLRPKADLEGKSLMVSLKREYSEQFGDQNKIGGYGKFTSEPRKVAAGAEDDDVPF